LLNFSSDLSYDIEKVSMSNFISLIKKTFQNSDEKIYDKLFINKKTKPYVFSPYLGRNFKEKIGPNISIIFSSGDYEIISSFWNGILALKNKGEDFISINGRKFFLKDIKILNKKEIKNSVSKFKTIGVSILTDPSKNSNDFNNWFLIPKEENLEYFNEVLNKRTSLRFQFIKNKKMKENIKFYFDKKNSIKEVIIPHYKGYLKGFKGCFIIEGNPEVLNFLFDFGFGVRTGQGFGLLEIVE